MQRTAVKQNYHWRWSDWKWQVRNRIRSLEELKLALGAWISPAEIDRLVGLSPQEFTAIGQSFRYSVTPYYLRLSTLALDCPVWRQIHPDRAEISDTFFSNLDPLGEEESMPVPGLTHRYPDRVLWYISHSCAVYCRFCLRKRKVSHGWSAPKKSDRQAVLAYLEACPEIKEVILSGGDPFILPDLEIAELLGELSSLKTQPLVRIHTRMPVVAPMRVTNSLCAILKRHYPITLVTHFNHACEITEEAIRAIKRLRLAGVQVLNQSVLLAGVNDSACSQKDLIEGLLKAGVTPYYLHHLDEVKGVSHFKTDLFRGAAIIEELRGRLPGHAIPRYMVDLTGGGGKVPLEKSYFVQETSEAYLFQNWAGQVHAMQK